MTVLKPILSRAGLGLLLLSLLLAACQPDLAALGAQTYSGTSTENLAVNWEGPAILHIEAGRGIRQFQVIAPAVSGSIQLVESDGPVDEYRAHIFPAGPGSMMVSGENHAWKITILPPSTDIFPVLHIPGEYKGRGNTVLGIEGEYSIATFNIDRVRRIEAWVFGQDTPVEKLYIKPDGDYKGKAVLPEGVQWMVVSAAGPWSVKIMEPCCRPPQ